MGQLRYQDFELKIKREGNSYSAEVLDSPSGEAISTFSLPVSEDKLENLILKIGFARTGRGFNSAEMEAARELGGILFENVFNNKVRECLSSSLSKLEDQEEMGLRLKLRLQDAPELANLPWEFLFDSSLDRFFAQSIYTPIVRYLEMPQKITPLQVNFPLKILVMISNPANQKRLDVGREQSQLQKALNPLTEAGLVQVDFLEKATLAVLQRYLREDKYHIFHFIGHGTFNEKTEEGVLVLEDEYGNGWSATAHRVGTLLHDHRSLRLAVLNSCEGARVGLADPFAGVASSLIRQGVPAVIAMQFTITDEAAITFSGEFYAALASGFPVDAAMAEARKAIYAQPNDVEWGTPVLYMRTPDGVLFDLEKTPDTVAKPPVRSPSTEVTNKPAPIELPAPSKKFPPPEKPPEKPKAAKKSTQPAGQLQHLIEIMPEGTEIIFYDDKEVSRKDSLFGATHTFQVSEEGENVKYTVEIGPRGIFGVYCEVNRNGEMIFSDRTSNLIVLNVKGHRIEIKPEGTEIIRYDGKEVSRKDSIFGATHKFQVREDGEKVQYTVQIGSRGLGNWCEVSRNGDFIYSNRTSGLRKLWV
jgi:hypothetical protein